MAERRRFPPPWDIEKANAACFIVKDNNGQALAYVYFEQEPGRRTAANLLTKDEARRIAVNICRSYNSGGRNRLNVRARKQIADWLEKLGLGQYAQRFAENDINFAILPDLTDQDLKEIGVTSLGRGHFDLSEVRRRDSRPEPNAGRVLSRCSPRPVNRLNPPRCLLEPVAVFSAALGPGRLVGGDH
jgi:hypothetical protein